MQPQITQINTDKGDNKMNKEELVLKLAEYIKKPIAEGEVSNDPYSIYSYIKKSKPPKMSEREFEQISILVFKKLNATADFAD